MSGGRDGHLYQELGRPVVPVHVSTNSELPIDFATDLRAAARG